MKVLFYGAGVIGSLYAAHLQATGHDVSILARGQRLRDLKDYGIVLEQALTHEQSVIPVHVVEQLSPDDMYDLIVVAMRKNHVSAVLPQLSRNQKIPTILFMLNNSAGYEEWIKAVGSDRLVVGFPGAAGSLDGHIVRYIITHRMQPTTLGELDGRKTFRIHQLANLFREAGFPVAIAHNIDAWQKTHVALISPIAEALYVAGGSNYRLSQMPGTLRLMIRAIREGFQVLRALNIPITPAKLKLWEWVPEPILVALLKFWVHSYHFEIVAARHANAARDEMQRLATEFQLLARQTSVPTPTLDQLEAYIDLANPSQFKTTPMG